jgi:integrase
VTVHGETYESVPKTAAGQRTIPLDAALVSRLTDRRRQQAAERLRAGSAWTDSGYVFADALGRPYPPEHFTGRFDVLVKAAKLRRITLHGTRHTAASLMLADGVQPKVVQEMLGHSHVSVTLGIYGHVTPSMAEAAGAALSQRLLG